MPLQHLIDYFNQRFTEENGLKEPPLLYRAGKALGRSGGALFGSRLRPVRLNSQPPVISGYDAAIRVESPEGHTEAAAQGLFADGAVNIVNLDRLARTVHMLNFLSLPREEGCCLFVHVHPRHILALKRDHGAYFEEIIASCGLSPRRVVITLAVNPGYASQLGLLLERLKNYRARGYATAIKFDSQPGDSLPERYCLGFLHRHTPDFVRFDSQLFEKPTPVPSLERRHAALFAAIRRLDTQLLIEGIHGETQARWARAINADFVQGDWYEYAAGEAQASLG